MVDFRSKQDPVRISRMEVCCGERPGSGLLVLPIGPELSNPKRYRLISLATQVHDSWPVTLSCLEFWHLHSLED